MRCDGLLLYPDRVRFKATKVNDKATEERLASLCKEVGLDVSSGAAYENYVRKNIDKATVYEKEYGFIQGKVTAISFRESQKLFILCISSGNKDYDLSVKAEDLILINKHSHKNPSLIEFIEEVERWEIDGVTPG